MFNQIILTTVQEPPSSDTQVDQSAQIVEEIQKVDDTIEDAQVLEENKVDRVLARFVLQQKYHTCSYPFGLKNGLCLSQKARECQFACFSVIIPIKSFKKLKSERFCPPPPKKKSLNESKKLGQ